MSIGNLLFFIAIILSFITISLEILELIFEARDKEKITDLILKILSVFFCLDACFLICSLVILYFELGGIK